MPKYLLFLAILLVVLGFAQEALAQSRPDQRRAGEAPFVGSDASPNLPASGEKEVSAQARALAKQSYQMGVKYARANLFRQAAQSFQKAVEYDPAYADAHYGLGHAYLDLEQWREAIQAFEQAVRFNPRNEQAHTKLAEARLKLHIATSPPSEPDNTSAKKENKPDDENGPVIGGNGKESPTPAGPIVKTKQEVTSNAPSETETANKTSEENQPPDVKLSKSESTDAPALTATAAPKVEEDPTRIYRVGIGDILEVRLGGPAQAQSTLLTVTAAGLLEHPNLVEPMPVSGLTIDEIKARLEDDLRRRAIIENASVVVAVREYLSHAILVSGLVKEPGTKLLRREAIPLYVVIADSQPLAEAGRLTLVKHETGETLTINLLEPAEMNHLVGAGDVITVQPAPKQFFYVGGEVKSPGEKPYRPGLTLTQVILIAEGLTNKGKEAHVARENGNGFLQLTRYKLKSINSGKLADPIIQPGDRITIVD